MSNVQNVNSLGVDGGEALKKFQLTTEGIKDKSSREYGEALSRYINTTVMTGLGGYYANRNARFIKNRNYANGKMDIEAMFRDRLQMNAKTNFISLNWQTLQIVNRIVSGLVGRWMQRNEKIQVTAIDTISAKDKQDEFEQIEFILYNREQLERLEQESGVQIIPKDDFIPADKEELNLWQAQFQRIPEEILYEIGCNDILSQNGLYDSLKEKILHDAAEVLFVGTYTWMDEEGVVHVERIKPENAIYSYSEYDDFRDTTWRGHLPSMKISEIRKKYGKEFNPNNPFALTENEIWEKVVPHAKEYTLYTNITWTDNWYNAFLRPYDEWNVRSIHFELKTVDSEPYTITNTKGTGSTYVEKGVPKKPSDNRKVVTDTYCNIYRGVYLPDCNILLEWGLKKNMIRPQDPKEAGNAEFSYSFQMPQNYMMRNMAIPEKIEAAVDGMILALLKMQQVVARMRPTGAAIDESALQNIDYGLGDAGNSAIDPKKVYDQTGDIYYRGIDAEGNRVPIPITELQNSGFLGQMQGLIAIYQFHYQTLKDELGEDPSLMSAALQPRVTGQNVEASQTTAEYATDYIYRAYTNCMADTARKISCLLKDSVTYGAKVYRDIIKAEDIGERIFSTKVQFLPTQNDILKFEALLNQAMGTSPDLVMFLDPFQIMRVAKEDVKLAELIFRQAQRKMIKHQQQMQRENQEATFQAQQQSAITAEEEKRKTAELQALVEKEKSMASGESENKSTVLNGVFQMLQKQQETGNKIPDYLMPLVTAVIENVALSATIQSEEKKSQVLQQMQAAAQAQQEQGQPMPQQNETSPQAA